MNNTFLRNLTLLGLVLLLAACGDDNDAEESCTECTEAEPDAGVTDVGASSPDASEDSTPDATDPVETDVSLADPQVRAATGDAGDGRVWLFEAYEDELLLSMELYESFGGPNQPGRVDIVETETDYLTCGTCLILRTGCSADGDDFNCAKTFMPKAGGSVEFRELGLSPGTTIAGTTEGVVFQEVTIDSDYSTDIVPNGSEVTLEDFAFSATLTDLETPPPECGGHGHLHGSSCHCDSGYEVDPFDSTRCIPE